MQELEATTARRPDSAFEIFTSVILSQHLLGFYYLQIPTVRQRQNDIPYKKIAGFEDALPRKTQEHSQNPIVNITIGDAQTTPETKAMMDIFVHSRCLDLNFITESLF